MVARQVSYKGGADPHPGTWCYSPPRFFLPVFILFCWLQGLAVLRAEPATPADYFPLAVGNRWVYESSEGTAAAPALESWEVIRQKETLFVVRIKQPFTTEGIEDQFVSTADGISQVSEETGNRDALQDEPRFLLKAPLTPGASWENGDGRYAITAVDETANVPAGTFTKCVEVTRWSAGGTATVVTLYAPGVGMVQREERFRIIGGIGGFDTPQQGRTVLRLKEWAVNSPVSGVQRLESGRQDTGE